MENKIKVMWKGTPSQYENFPKYLLTGFLLIVALVLLSFGLIFLGLLLFFLSTLVTFYYYLVIEKTQYVLTNRSLKKRSGVFSRETEELMLYRIQDIVLEEPFLLRLVKIANLKLTSVDQNKPVFYITSIKNGELLRKALRDLSEKERERTGVRAIDIARNKN